MKQSLVSSVLLLVCLLLSSVLSVFSADNNGKITGKVTDQKTGEALIGVTVIIQGTSTGAVTDVEGRYTINVAPGTYTIEFKYMGYQTKSVSEVVVKAASVTALPVIMDEPKSKELQEVVIRGSFKQETINALYTAQRNNAAVSDGISADVIRKSPDRSTGEVLKRVSGTTIQDNKFVIVRGLSDRYNAALVDNASLPSTEPNRKAFSFDIIPANMIDNVVITKSATPDLPGDFAGGVINVHTKEIPDQYFLDIAVGTGFNTASTFKNFRSGYKSNTDFIGFDNGRQMPSSFPSTSDIVNNRLTGAQQIAAQKSLNNNYNIKSSSGLPAASLQATLGNHWNVKKDANLGMIAAVTYSHNETVQRDMIRHYDNFDYVDNVYKYSSNLGGVFNLGYSAGKNKVVWKNLYNRIFDDNFLFRTGDNLGSSKYVNYYAFDLVQKSLFKTALEGDHQVGKGQSKINWILSYNKVINNQPDQRKVSYGRAIDDATAPLIADIGTVGKANNRLFSDLDENIYIANISYSHPFRFLDNKSTFKIGALGQYRTRNFHARYIGLKLDQIKDGADAVAQRPIESLYANDVLDQNYYTLDDITSTVDEYRAKTTTGAGYLQFDNRLSDKFRLVWGARVEYFNLQLNAPINNPSVKVDNDWIDVLPSANLTYMLNETSNLRASYYRTVARPELREVAPLSYYDYEMSSLINGNPRLVRSQIDNADIRYELFPNPGEVLSGSVFYKHFKNPIESRVTSSGLSQYDITPNNYPSAYNVGAEVEVRKKLGFLAENSFLNSTTFYANVAYIKSVVDDNTVANGKDRPLSGQSNYVINTSLSYALPNDKVSFNLLYNRIGQRLYLVGEGGGADGSGKLGNIYESPRNLLDFQASATISKRSSFRLNVKDILNARYQFYYDQNGNNKFDNPVYRKGSINTSEDYLLSRYRPGTTFTLTYTYHLTK
ncbi:TonB-dependent receptor [Chitinophaga tropicalis]|uniref:TonB-dependent receptor plug domain-containing protein n=1 Tax=Chitinophaga tropicalis TaxID=2683588 RepID=A0A7K1TX07_9BACT|nr:TonB-dependent receptor [Chitinophaga tropicalis]MVT06639.1 TonB-dependent receptor plug domain-containing protein [Chitinophaga tropicalis]